MMTGHIPGDRLSDYVDGELPPPQAAEVTRHLAGCELCEREALALRTLVAELRCLPGRMEPPHDLRPAIAAAIAERPAPARVLSLRPTLHFFSRARYSLAAAAVILIALTATVTRWASRTPAGDVVASTPLTSPTTPAARGSGVLVSEDAPGVIAPAAIESGPVAAQATFQRDERRYMAQIRELQRELERQRDRLSPETVRILERNLAVIDRAITESRAALERDPANRLLGRLILAAYEQKVELLRRANALAAS